MFDEAENLRSLFATLDETTTRTEFARQYGIAGGGAMIYQHVTGRKPISLAAAIAYARGFRRTLDEISPSAAALARDAIAVLAPVSTASATPPARYDPRAAELLAIAHDLPDTAFSELIGAARVIAAHHAPRQQKRRA